METLLNSYLENVSMKEEPKYKTVLNVICLTILMLDSGGGLGLRNIAFLIIIVFGLYGMYKYRSFNKNFIYAFLIFLISLIPGIMISFLNSVPIFQIINWVMSFLLLPFFYFYAKGSELSNKCFVIAGGFFSTIVILLFFGRLMNFGAAIVVNDYITSHSDGFFGNKNFLSGAILPNVYFQGTLSVIICGCLSLRKNNYLTFFIILLGLILAPSRFGFMVLILWALFLFLRKSWVRLFYLPVIFMVVFVILKNLAFGQELFSAFTGESDAIEVRNGHFISIYTIFKDNPLSFLFGQGPGSIFFTKGTYSLVDNIEISQLEFIRKYGIFSLISFCLFYFMPLLGRFRSDIYLKGAIVIYFVVSFSNPVLFSIFSMLFLAFVYVKVFDNKKIIC
jgi:hypothetical protein